MQGQRAVLGLALVLCVLSRVAHAKDHPQWHCDPLVPEVCGYPFPNNFFRGDDGFLNMTTDTFPRDRDNQSVNPDVGGWNQLDGFSPLPMIVTFFKNVDPSMSKLPGLWNPMASLNADSPSILLNAKTLQRVPHWVELDHSADDIEPNGYERTMIVRPAERLNDSETYIVAFQGLVSSNGEPVIASDAFTALRDGSSSSDPTINARRGYFESNVFSPLLKAGVNRTTLTLAWDFTVSSTKTQTNRIVTMRDDAFERTANGIPFTITRVQDSPREGIAREIHGIMEVPWYLTELAPGMSVRVNTAQGDPNTPLYNGQGLVTFTVVIPDSLVQNGTKGAVMQYGHGLFGSQSEVEVGYLGDEANRYGYVLIATNWLGMCYEDEIPAASIIAENLNDFAAIPDRSHQGMLNALLLMRLATSDEFVNNKHVVFNGQSVIDPTRRYYYGNSQGGIFGTVYMGVTTDVTRGVIGVGGCPYSLLLPRSADFAALFDILKLRYPDSTTRISILAGMQLLWDRMEPAGYLHHISRDPLPNTPQHTIIGHYGLGDAQVTWLGMLVLGRSVGASMFESNVHEGNETLALFPKINDNATLTGVGQHLVQGWDFGAPQVPFVNIPASKKTDAHEKPRRSLRAQEATHLFLTEGVVRNTCAGPCKNVP
eukprot:m.356907 g.356907  ORF g.356907 m.356907 type:complete len:654 (+) comp17657_c0_seq1:91-2052(+)